MNEVAGGPVSQFLRRPTEIFQELAVEKLRLTRRIHGRYEPGNAVHYQAQTLFARSQGFLGTLPVVNIRVQAHPADDAAFRVPQGEAA